MGQTEGSVTYNTFTGGIITEASQINFPPSASLNEENLVLFRKGNRRRRLGIDYRTGSTLSSTTYSLPASNSTTTNFSYFLWEAVAGDGDLNFLVFQIASRLHFYSQANLTQVGLVDLNDHAIGGATNIGRDKVKMTYSNGRLFVAGRRLNPFYCTYASGSISSTSISLRIRDFIGLDDGLAPDTRPSTLSPEHEYNLLNQGWYGAVSSENTDLINKYESGSGAYPSNVQVWFLGKGTNDQFSWGVLDNQSFGNTRAPKGHYIMNPFNKNYSNVSGVAGLTPSTLSVRPVAVAAFSGRVWWAGLDADKVNGDVYFSQVLDSDLSNVGRCYQEADPTSEEDSMVVDTDGGQLQVSNVGRILAMKATEDSLLIFGDNGVWAINGGDGGFKATDFSLNQITNVGLFAPDSIIEVEGRILYWSKEGIYSLEKEQVTNRYVASSITAETIQTLFDNIPDAQKANCQAIYDKRRRQIQWLYSDTNTTTYRRDKVLLLDISLGAFFPYSLKNLGANSPFVLAGLDKENSNSWYSSSVLYLTLEPQAPDFNIYKFTFSEFKNPKFKDWFSINNSGVDATAFLEAGYEFGGDIMRKKQLKYVLCYFERTETAFQASLDGGFEFNNPSACTLRVKWEWATSEVSERWSTPQNVYRIPKMLPPDESNLAYNDGFPVVVTKNKIRGNGRALQYRYDSVPDKDFNLLGWAAVITGETDV